jgi:hypothetical protein
MSEPLDSLPPDLKAMLRADQASLVAPMDGQSRLSARLAASVPAFGAVHAVTTAAAVHAAAHATGTTPVTAASIPMKALVAPWIVKAALAVAVSAGVLGVVGTTVHLSDDVAKTRAPISTPTVTPPAPVSRTFDAPPLPQAPEAPIVRAAPVTPHARTSNASPSPSAVPTSPTERENEQRMLLDGARDAIKRGEPEAALASTADFMTRFPHSDLAPQCYALRIRALAKLGRKTDARALLMTMRASYPQSFHLEDLSNEVESIP